MNNIKFKFIFRLLGNEKLILSTVVVYVASHSLSFQTNAAELFSTLCLYVFVGMFTHIFVYIYIFNLMCHTGLRSLSKRWQTVTGCNGFHSGGVFSVSGRLHLWRELNWNPEPAVPSQQRQNHEPAPKLPLLERKNNDLFETVLF